MKKYCYYYDSDRKTYHQVDKFQLSSIKKDDKPKFLRMKESLYIDKTPLTQMVFVGKGTGNKFGFRKKGESNYDDTNVVRGKNKSQAHKIVQHVLANLSEVSFQVRSSKDNINVRIIKAELEKEVKINGKKYYADLCLEIEQIDDLSCITKFPKFLYIEIVDSHDLTERKLIDFEIMGLSIARYEVNDYIKDQISLNESTETNYNRVYKILSNNMIYIDYINYDCTLNQYWNISKNGNHYLVYEGNNVTLFDNSDSYAFIVNGNRIDKYKGVKIIDFEFAKRYAEFLLKNIDV